MMNFFRSARYRDSRETLSNHLAAWRGTRRALWDRQIQSKGRNRLLLGARANILFRDLRSVLILENSAEIPAKDEAFTAAYPCAAAIGIGPGWRFLDPPAARRTKITLNSAAIMRLHQNIRICPGTYISCGNGTKLTIESDVYIGHEVKLYTTCRVRIGQGSIIGQNVFLMDYDGHPIFPDTLREEEIHAQAYGGARAPIDIGKHVWVGQQSIILKGVSIGDGAMIGAGSVVVGDIPPRCVAAGNPARVIKEKVRWRK